MDRVAHCGGGSDRGVDAVSRSYGVSGRLGARPPGYGWYDTATNPRHFRKGFQTT